MRAAVHGNICFVDWETAYHPDQTLHPRASLALYNQTLGPSVAVPTDVPQPLLALAGDPRSMKGGGRPIQSTSRKRPRNNGLVSDDESDLEDVFLDVLGEHASTDDPDVDRPGKRRRLMGESIREERDRLRKQPLDRNVNPKTLLVNHLDAEHLVEAMTMHAISAWIDLYPRYGHLRKFVPAPPQVLPLVPKKGVIRPLKVLDEDEGTVVGNIKVIQKYVEYVAVKDKDLADQVIPVTGDAYTQEKCTIAVYRREDDLDPEKPNLEQLQFVQPWPALFHTQMSFAKNILTNHAGNSSTADPFSIKRLSQLAGHKNLVSGTIKFHDANRFLHVLFPALVNSLVTGPLQKNGTLPSGSLDQVDPPPSLTYDKLSAAMRLILKPVLSNSAESLGVHKQMKPGQSPDLVYLHGATLLRECGIFIEFQDAIRQGDLGRIVICLKHLVPIFQASGQSKYVIAMSEMIINLKFEFPAELKLHMLGGLIVNRNGKAGNFVPLDLHQEQDVMFIKDVFNLHGSSTTVKQMATLGANIHVFRGCQEVLNTGLKIASLNNKHTQRSQKNTIAIISNRINQVGGFQWIGSRNSANFELPTGVHTKKYSSSKATDHFVAGVAGLIGTRAKVGSFATNKQRRHIRLGKKGITSRRLRPKDQAIPAAQRFTIDDYNSGEEPASDDAYSDNQSEDEQDPDNAPEEEGDSLLCVIAAEEDVEMEELEEDCD